MERTLHFRENWLTLSWGIWGEAELILRIWGAKEKYFQGAEVFFFQGFGEINALFSGIKGAQTPPPPLSRTLAKLFQLLHKVYQRVSGKY